VAEGSSCHTYYRAFDPRGDDSLAKIARRIPRRSTVLDVGCGPGVLSAYLTREKECVVDAIDIDAQAVDAAAGQCRTARRVDLDRSRPTEVFGDRRYSVIVCADVLEHVVSPAAVLDDLRQLLVPEGRLLVSIPNVAYAGVTGELLQGRFQYRDEGILDRTHRHFLTRAGVVDLLQGAGFDVLEMEPVVVDLTRSEFDPCIDTLPPEVVNCLLSAPDALAYQFVAECAPRSATRPIRPGAPAERPGPKQLRFYVQAYWRAAAESFSEERRCWAAAEVGQEHQTIRLELPGTVRGPTELRFDPADRPGYLRIGGISLCDHRGDRLWRWNHDVETLSRSKRHELEFSAVGEDAVALSAGHDPWVLLPIPRETLARITQGGRIEVELSWPRSADFLVLAPKVQELEQEREAAGAEIGQLKSQLDTAKSQLDTAREACGQLKSQLGEALRLRAEAESQSVRNLKRAGRAEVEKEWAIGGVRDVWGAVTSSLVDAVNTLVASRAWRLGNGLGNLVNRLKGRPEVDLTREVRAACTDLDEAAQGAMGDARQWLAGQATAFDRLKAKAAQVSGSRRYGIGRLLGRLASAVRPWRPWVDPASGLAAAVQMASRGMESWLAAGRLSVVQAGDVKSAASHGRQRFVDPVDIVVALGNVAAEERANLERLIETTSPPYHLWLAAPAALRGDSWLSEFAATQGAFVVWREAEGTPDKLLEQLRRSSSPAVAFLSAAAPMPESWLDDALAALNEDEGREVVPLDVAGADAPVDATIDAGWPRRMLARKKILGALERPAPSRGA